MNLIHEVDMSIFLAVAELGIKVIEAAGLAGVLILMTLESALIPIPSEVVMVFAGFLVHRGVFTIVEATLAGTLGNVLGSVAAYILGYRIGRPFIIKYGRYLLLSKEHVAMAEDFFSKRGNLAVFIGRLMPAIRTVISFPAGLARMNFIPFVMLTFLGSLPWNLALTYIGVMLGERWNIVEEFSLYIDLVGIVAITLFAYYILKRRGS